MNEWLAKMKKSVKMFVRQSQVTDVNAFTHTWRSGSRAVLNLTTTIFYL